MRDGLILIIGLLTGLSIYEAYPAESDKQKWERIERNREVRRAMEQKYEHCVAACYKRC